jgi:hypothetical protein
LLLPPAIAIGVPTIVLLAPILGRFAFPPPPYHYWTPELLVRKPTVQAGYLLGVTFAVVYAVAIVLMRDERFRIPRRRALVLAAQAAVLAFVALAWIEQRNVHVPNLRRTHFTISTVIVAAVIAGGLSWLIAGNARSAAIAHMRDPLALRSRVARGTCLAIAVVATGIWLLPAIATDRNVSLQPATAFLARFAFDEAMSVLNGRSPLVNMVAYGSIWPYVTAVPLRELGATYGAFAVTMTTITGLSLLAVYALFRRVTGRALAALVLYLPFLATSLFIESTQHTSAGDTRYYPANYFGMFPLRYAGPFLLAWLTARFLDGARPHRLRLELLFLAAGLVAINNLDFGVPALGGTVAALASTAYPPERERLLALGRGIATGLAAALVAVSLLTLVRAGSLPHLGLLVRYGRVFALGGFGNLPLPGLGFHLVVTTTFVAALAVAAVRTRARRTNLVLTGMLAWSGIFGLGASAYFYAYDSHPFTLINLFSAWSLALALLVVAVVGDGWRRRRWLTPPEVAVLLGFGLMVCSVAQIPRPWSELRRLQTEVAERPMRAPAFVSAVASVTKPGERVAIVDALGHRFAREAGVVNVIPYTGLEQMDTSEQMDDILSVLQREGGLRVFVPLTNTVPPGVVEGALTDMRHHGYVIVDSWPGLVELMPAGVRMD